MRGREKECLKDTLMDGELVMDTEPNNNDKVDIINLSLIKWNDSSANQRQQKVWRFLIFDLMALNGVPVTKRSFNTRLGVSMDSYINKWK